jgi:hypothetical protein
MSSQFFTSSRTFFTNWGQKASHIAHKLRLKWVVPILVGLLLLATNVVMSSTSHIPTISIVSVDMDNTVTVRTHNYPANRTFTVRMGEMGTLGIGGIVVDSISSGSGGSFEATFDIPPELQGRHRIAIRLDSTTGGYYSYNWFYNTPLPAPSPPYVGIPTFKIDSVTRNDSVTIVTHNFPANQTFTVRMGLMGTRGINGHIVGTIDSGAGGVLTETFTIPPALHGLHRISIRAETAHARPYYAYNWFYNTDAPPSGDPGSGGEVIPGPVYVGYPTMNICTVTRDGQVEIKANNFPPNQTFTVTMGPMFSRGIGGTVVDTIQSGQDRYTFTIPANLHGSYRIAIRAQTSHAYPYFAYNWFFNNNTLRDHCN